jgi:hypothetical protein
MITYKTRLALYPVDVRESYGDEMMWAYGHGLMENRRRGPMTLVWFIASHVIWLLCDAAAERVLTLYSHRSFHGRCRPDLSLVRPPNMSKKEWFHSKQAGT